VSNEQARETGAGEFAAKSADAAKVVHGGKDNRGQEAKAASRF
jgi:hypothetical protein